MSSGILRGLATASHFMVFASAAIVTGLISRFLHTDEFRNAHIIYQEVIATITLAFYLVAMVMPLIKSYRGYLLPLDLAFSYLWLTSFIFSAQDWSAEWCHHSPHLNWSCRNRKTVESFNFIAFFFLLCNVVIEGLMWSKSSKERPGNGNTADNTA